MLCKAAGTFHKRLNGFTAEALAAMERYDWPGNLRELENAVERAVLLAQGDVVGLAELPRSMSATRTSERLRPRAPLAGVVPVAESEERLIREAVAAFNGNIRQSSRHLGLSRSTLYRKMKKYHIDGDSPRQ
ncbi:MAG: hypothetical protein LUE17_01545 [Planctomycetaceae bacterium]|nr:hypothetical protein [Planctomycetaceae bacterium]